MPARLTDLIDGATGRELNRFRAAPVAVPGNVRKEWAMSRGEETNAPSTGSDHAVPEEPVELSKPESAGKASGPSSRFEVVISSDGSAAIDGEPVPTENGEGLDAAILDILHGLARDRNTAVTADISDPSADYVAHVEVAPDGSSRLLEEHWEQATEHAEGSDAQAEHAVPEEPYGDAGDAWPADVDDDGSPYVGLDVDSDDDRDEGSYNDLDEEEALDDELDEEEAFDDELDEEEAFDDELDEAVYALPQPVGPPSAPSTRGSAPAPAPAPAPGIARRSGSRQSDDEYAPPGLLHRPLVVGPVALGVAALVIVPLVIVGSGGSGGGRDEAQAARATSETSRTPSAEEPAPTKSVTPSMMPPPPSTTAKPKDTTAKPKDTSAAKGSGGGTVTVTAKPPRATVTAKPPTETAATAVNRLAKNDPTGRHICYRAYVTGRGWQKPVCDGTIAGTTGQHKPIKALNVAVSGTGGSAANAFVHDPDSTNGQGKWKPEWTAVIADGKNNYIGSTHKSAPYMTGFAINIGSGQVCQTAKVHGYDWGGQGCADPRPGFVFGGASTGGSTSTGSKGTTSGSSSSGSTGSGSSGSGKGSGTAAQAQSSTSVSMCKTDKLAFSASATGTRNEIVVSLKNTGSGKCSMHGFPGVQLVGPDGLGDTGPDTARTDASAPTVTIGSGEETRFLLRYIPDTSGAGKEYTRLDVTPPNEKVSQIVNLDGLAFTISASSGNAPDVYVDPVGYHVGSGK